MNKLESTIKIGRQSTANGSAKGKTKAVVGKSSSTKNVDKVTLSKTSKTQASTSEVKNVASEIRQDLVTKFRDILEKGSYEVKANEIADKIVQKIKENKNLIKEKERILWNKCNHNWVRDTACSDDDLCKKYCSICLLRNCYLF